MNEIIFYYLLTLVFLLVLFLFKRFESEKVKMIHKYYMREIKYLEGINEISFKEINDAHKLTNKQ